MFSECAICLHHFAGCGFFRHLEDVVLETPFALVWHSKCPGDFDASLCGLTLGEGLASYPMEISVGYYRGVSWGFYKDTWANSFGKKKICKKLT